jgi:hypothetical protein
MSPLLSWFRRKRDLVRAKPVPVFLQSIIHIASIYLVARRFIPWLPNFTDAQFFSSFVFLFSLLAGIVVGFINGRLWRHSVVRFVWIFPAFLLALLIYFRAPGIYPTMPFQSDWGEGLRYYFVPVGGLPSHRLTQGDLRNASVLYLLLHLDTQLRAVVPAIVGISYSLGALLSEVLRIPIPELCLRSEGPTPGQAA